MRTTGKSSHSAPLFLFHQAGSCVL
jgi:hypothetical protein